MTTRWHFEQGPFDQTLKIFAYDVERGLQFTYQSSDFGGAIRQEHLAEGAVPDPFMEMSYQFAGPFIDAFKQFLGERNDLPESAVPKEIFDREQQRVDKLIDFAISPPSPPTLSLRSTDG